MDVDVSRKNVTLNLFWRLAERGGAQGVSFIVSIVLARILVPDDYGKVAIITVIMQLLQVFIDGGLGNALIQKKDADDLDFSSVFYFNMVFCVVIYGVLYICAPLIADYYNDVNYIEWIRVLGLILIISGVKNVQQAYVSRTLQFKMFFFATLIGTIISAFVGIAMALYGLGVWALIAQNLVNALIDTIVVWKIVKWRPHKEFSITRLKSLLSYGWKLLASNLIDTLYGNIRQLLIGKLYTSSDLAYYNRGRQFPNIIVMNVNTSIDNVLFPVMSYKQGDMNGLKKLTRKSIMVSNYIMAPLMIGLACAADTIVRLVLTEKWLPCVPFLRVFCVIYLFQPIHTANINVIKAMGRSDLVLKLEVIKKTIGIILLLVSMNYGVMAIAYTYLANNFLNQIINSWPNKRLLNYSYKDQIMDILPSTTLALVMAICVIAIGHLNINSLLLLLIQIFVGMVVYALGSFLFKLEAFSTIREMSIDYISKKRSSDMK